MIGLSHAGARRPGMQEKGIAPPWSVAHSSGMFIGLCFLARAGVLRVRFVAALLLSAGVRRG
jgi:hypothetical protein